MKCKGNSCQISKLSNHQAKKWVIYGISLADSLVFIPSLFATHHENKENFGLQSTLVEPWCPFVFLYLLTAKLKLYPHLSQRQGRVELRFGLFMYAREGNGCIFGKFCSRNFVSSGRHMFSKPNLAVTL